MKSTLAGIAGAVAILSAFVLIGLSGVITPDYGYKNWTARQLAMRGKQAMDCEQHETITPDHTMSAPACECFCPPDAAPGVVTFLIDSINCACK